MNLSSATRCGRFKGRKELIAHLEGNRLSASQASLAKCFECMCGYADGAQDCRIPDCPNYPRMPYRLKIAPSCPPIVQRDAIQQRIEASGNKAALP